MKGKGWEVKRRKVKSWAGGQGLIEQGRAVQGREWNGIEGNRREGKERKGYDSGRLDKA